MFKIICNLFDEVGQAVAIVSNDGTVVAVNKLGENSDKMPVTIGQLYPGLKGEPLDSNGQALKKRLLASNRQVHPCGEEHWVVLPIAVITQETEEARGRLETVGLVSTGVVHDINNILTGILGHVSFLQRNFAETGVTDAGILGSLESISAGAYRSAEMCRQILGFARGDDGEETEVNVVDLVKVSVDLLQPAFGNIPVALDIQQSDCTVWGNRNYLSQMFLNLVMNARDAIVDAAEGRIQIVISKQEVTSPKEARFGRLEGGNYIVLEVSDTGEGMNEETKKMIFEPFFTTKGGAGNGIGLATVARILEEIAGDIEVESEAGNGAIFRVFIPEYLEKTVQVEAPQEKAYPSSPSLPEGKEKILVVDDEDAVRTVIHRSLVLLGYDVESVASAKEALVKFHDEKKRYDLVLLDMMMPNMCGDELFFELKSSVGNVNALICSGFISDDRANRVLEGGGTGFCPEALCH